MPHVVPRISLFHISLCLSQLLLYSPEIEVHVYVAAFIIFLKCDLKGSWCMCNM